MSRSCPRTKMSGGELYTRHPRRHDHRVKRGKRDHPQRLLRPPAQWEPLAERHRPLQQQPTPSLPTVEIVLC